MVCPALDAGTPDDPYLWHCTLPVGHTGTHKAAIPDTADLVTRYWEWERGKLVEEAPNG